MKTTAIKILLFFLFSFSFTYSQVPDSLKHNIVNIGIGISPIYEFSRIINSNVDLFGINMSVITINDEIGISIQKLNPSLNYKIYKFDIFSSQIDYKKYFNISNSLFLSCGISLGNTYNKIIIQSWTDVTHSSTYLFFKPQVGLDYYIWKKFFININIGYRITFIYHMSYKYIPELLNFTNKDFSDFYLNFAIKYIFVLK